MISIYAYTCLCMYIYVYKLYINTHTHTTSLLIAYIKPLLDNLVTTSFNLAQCDLHVAILRHMPWILSEPFRLIETAVPCAAACDRRSNPHS